MRRVSSAEKALPQQRRTLHASYGYPTRRQPKWLQEHAARSGDPRATAEDLDRDARAFAAAKPETIVIYIEDFEAEYRARSYAPASVITTTCCGSTSPASRSPASDLNALGAEA